MNRDNTIATMAVIAAMLLACIIAAGVCYGVYAVLMLMKG